MIRRIPAAGIVLLVAGACASFPPTDYATDLPQLVERPTAAGLAVEELGSRSPMPGFGSEEGLLVDEERITAFEYSDEASAKGQRSPHLSGRLRGH